MKNINRNLKVIVIITAIFILNSCNFGSNENYFKAISENDAALPIPKSGDWLFEFDEKGQTFKEFLKSNPLKPASGANIIYIRPIGEFTTLQKKQIELTREYLELFFQLKTKILEELPNKVIPNSAKRIGYSNNEQILAGYILDSILKKENPENGIAVMGLTELDLFPKPEWNYVFGLASYKDRVSVTSIFRLQDEKLTQENFNKCLYRLIKISSHEICHMFGLHHCIHAKCVMNGSNSLSETDRSIARLCSLCQQKLNSSIRYKTKKRLQELMKYYEQNKLTAELELLEKDWEKRNKKSYSI